MEQQGKKGLAIAGLIFGIAACVCCWAGYGAIAGIVCGIVGLILSILAKKSFTAIGQKSGMATAGLILSIVGLVLSVVMLIACVICVAAGSAAADEIANNPELQNEIASALDQISSSVQ
ncbi:MAG: DUF4190 domain-containing protein [Ruminococcus sp.]|uniref:DUF4190 domain-containing protein n=1 Tax=Ruminococcus sp. TaxID=41978 RepID=UPI0028737468|nr:DUF4190 domain-containing protein [Ruminococcus sp.]MBQ3284669.1 DUF4190 domain-containing protein [Ruminococcus sp.]